MPGNDYSIATISQYVGQELGVSEWITINQERINDFADFTGDHQWIHVNVERAKRESLFGTTIAHGYLTLSLVAALSMELGIIPAGVSQALICAAAGLAVAIPAHAGYNYLVSRVNSIVLDMERAASDIVNIVTEEGKPA